VRRVLFALIAISLGAFVLILSWAAVFPHREEGGEPTTSPLADDPDQLVVYSLDGTKEVRDEAELAEAKLKGEYLYTFPVLGKVQVTNARQRREVLAAIQRAVRNPPKPAHCFVPRHAVRTVKGGETVDMVICFQCQTYFTYWGVEPAGSRLTPAISPDPEPLFDKILSDAGVPLAKKGHE
jgi:hypothetical protein